jgi:hypothetical protein
MTIGRAPQMAMLMGNSVIDAWISLIYIYIFIYLFIFIYIYTHFLDFKPMHNF